MANQVLSFPMAFTGLGTATHLNDLPWMDVTILDPETTDPRCLPQSSTCKTCSFEPVNLWKSIGAPNNKSRFFETVTMWLLQSKDYFKRDLEP